MELLAAVVIVGIVALVVIPRISGNASASKKNACYTFKGNIEVQVQLWYRDKGGWPASNLSDIGADPTYFPENVMNCPVDGTVYVLDEKTHRVSGHTH